MDYRQKRTSDCERKKERNVRQSNLHATFTSISLLEDRESDADGVGRIETIRVARQLPLARSLGALEKCFDAEIGWLYYLYVIIVNTLYTVIKRKMRH